VKSESDYGASGRWIDMDHVRFDGDKPQKIGGTQKLFTDTFTGIARAAEAWSSYTGVQCLVWGTACTLYIQREGVLTAITPYRLDSTSIALPNPFTTNTANNFALAGENDGFTKVMLHMDGVDASTTFTDVSVGGGVRAWTAVGNAQIDTADSKFGGASGLFDGTGDVVTTPDSADFILGSGAFSIDFWFKVSGGDGTNLNMAGQSDNGLTAADSSFIIQRSSSGVVSFFLSDGAAFNAVIASTATYTTVSNPGWHHVEATRSGNTVYLFIDGASANTAVTFSGTVPNSTQILSVGARSPSVAASWFGWLDEFRLSVGAARHTAPFTPATAAYRGQTLVSVADAAHGIAAAGVIVNFSGAVAVGGVTISGDYAVTSITDSNNYVITYPDVATSSAGPGGGAGVIAKYTLNCGTVSSTYLVGWGVGTWGVGTGWGTSASLASALITEPTNWSFDVYGEDLVVNQLNNGIWIYDTSTGATRPNVLTNAPAQVRYACVTAERYIFALGCTTLAGPFDPMTVRWSDILDNTIWTPSSTNTANERKLQGGTRLMAGTKLSPGVTVVWSDSSLFLFQFTGTTQGASPIYSSRQVADKCGLVAQHAWTKAGGKAYWMSDSNLWMFSGYAQPIPNVNDVRSWVFDNLNKSHVTKAFAFYNQTFNEVWFVFPGLGATEPSLYVAVQLDSYAWIHGTWDRSAAATYTTSENRPVMFGTNGIVYLHEVDGLPTNDGAALPFSIELAPTDVQGGNISVDIFGFIPDFQTQGGTLSLYLYGLDHPRDSIAMSETLAIAPTDKFVDARCAGRQFGMILSSSTTDCDFRMGKWGLDVEGAGTKRGSRAAT